MDNFHLDILTDSSEEIKQALQIAFNHAPGCKAVGYTVVEETTLIFFWNDSNTHLWVDGRELGDYVFTKFPAPLELESASVLVKQWLKTAKRVGKYNDGDVGNSKAARVFNEDWGNVFHCSYAFVGVTACYAWHGK